jgi:hypothetical protein
MLWNGGDKFEGLEDSSLHLDVRRYCTLRHKYNRP